jgi:hypothetical protein
MRLDWEEVVDRPITSVFGLEAATMDNGSARWDAIAICIGSLAVLVTVEPDTDQVIVALSDPPVSPGWASIQSFDSALGKKLGWCWIGINSQGYKDSFTIALGGLLDPHCTFVAEASSLICFDLTPRLA